MKLKTVLFPLLILGFVGCSGKMEGTTMEPISTIEEAITAVNEYQGKAEDFRLAIADTLQDPAGANMAIITDAVLGKGFFPNGFEPGPGYRIYKYSE